MSTLKEIIYNIQNLSNRGEHTDDKKLNNRQLEFIINHFRAEIASQRVNSKKSLEGFWQELHNVKLEATREHRPYREDVKILRSKEPIPSIATGHDYGKLISFVGAKDDFMGFQQSGVANYNIDMENPYIRNLFFTVGGYLYVATKNNSMLREVFVRAVFNNPRESTKLNGGEDLFDLYNWEYPIPDGLIGQLNNLIINSEYRWMHILPQDLKNDGQDAEQ